MKAIAKITHPAAQWTMRAYSSDLRAMLLASVDAGTISMSLERLSYLVRVTEMDKRHHVPFAARVKWKGLDEVRALEPHKIEGVEA